MCGQFNASARLLTEAADDSADRCTASALFSRGGAKFVIGELLRSPYDSYRTLLAESAPLHFVGVPYRYKQDRCCDKERYGRSKLGGAMCVADARAGRSTASAPFVRADVLPPHSFERGLGRLCGHLLPPHSFLAEVAAVRAGRTTAVALFLLNQNPSDFLVSDAPRCPFLRRSRICCRYKPMMIM